MAIMCRRQALLCVLLLALCSSFSECQGETRCDAICNYDSIGEKCDRCRLRVPMRFGKRSSPPEEALLDSPEFFHRLKAADHLSSQFLQYLSQTLQRRSSEENGGRRSRQEADVGQPERRALALLDVWSANPEGMIRKKRTLQAPRKSDGWIRRAILARQRHLLPKPEASQAPSSEFFH